MKKIIRPDPRQMMREFRPFDVGLKKIRVGSPYDGGYVMFDVNLQRRRGGVAYSYGIGWDVEWDLEMAGKYGFEVFQYDHTVAKPPKPHRQFHFAKEGLRGFQRGESEGPKKKGPIMGALTDHILKNGHGKRDDLILKMDVEGSEWEVFGSEKDSTLQRFEQIVVEFHYLGTARLYRPFATILRKLNRIFAIGHVHANNYGRIYLEGKTTVPDTLEVSYIRRDLIPRIRASKSRFPTRLDRPCNPQMEDIRLDFYPFK